MKLYAVVLIFLIAWQASSEPLTVTSDAPIPLGKIPSVSIEMQLLHEDIERNPQMETLLALANLYLKGARRRGYEDWFHEAEFLLSRIPESEQMPTEYLLVKADVLQQSHQFSAALSTLNKIFKTAPHHLNASLMAARISLALQQFDGAQQHCLRLLRTEFFFYSVCSYEVLGRQGQWQISYNALKALWRRQGHIAPHLDQWIRAILAEQAEQLSLITEARTLLADCLEYAPSSVWVKWADLSIDLGEATVVFDKLHQQHLELPLSDALLLRLAKAERILNKETDYQRQIKERMQVRIARDDNEHAADVAFYYLFIQENPDQALIWAERNLAQAREPDDYKLLSLSRTAQTSDSGEAL